ncbi:unnamed protein product [Taenia asiatica]|uniref:Protein kinase domain-containing protein n=1 Tax=Taenia asiatica TaxID=60517 RepID=A0A0R3WC01_TAEAS|nr:unnamed protein product [Taenia asiatica]
MSCQLEKLDPVPTTSVNASLIPPVQNYFVCADWGVTSQRSAPSSLPPSSGFTERVAALEAFILPPSPRPLRQTNGKVFYVGTDLLESPSNVEKVVKEGEEEEVGEEPTRDLGLCLEMDVRLPSEHTDGPSKLTVKFRSMVQTIEASPTPILPPPSPPPPPEPVSTPVPSVEQKVAFISSLASWILWKPSSTSAQQHQLPRVTPPLNRWLHLTLPLDTQLLPESPLHFALYGHAGVCMDSLHVTRCLASTVSSLSWPPNNTLNLAQPTSPVLLFPPSHGDSAPSSSPTYHPLLTGAFFFACLLIILITLLIVIFVTSIVCGRRGRIRKRGRGVAGSGEKGGDGGPVTLTGAELLRSPSISSLPGAAVHQRPIEEILHCVDEDSVEKADVIDVEDEHHTSSGQGSLDARRLRLKRPQRRPPRRTQSVDSRLQIGHQLPPYEAPRQRPIKRVKKQSSSQQQSQYRRGRGWRSMDAEPMAEVAPQNSGQRLSLLLAINEDNELVLVTPGSTNASAKGWEVHTVPIARVLSLNHVNPSSWQPDLNPLDYCPWRVVVMVTNVRDLVL